jgi:hypothetical protein
MSKDCKFGQFQDRLVLRKKEVWIQEALNVHIAIRSSRKKIFVVKCILKVSFFVFVKSYLSDSLQS